MTRQDFRLAESATALRSGETDVGTVVDRCCDRIDEEDDPSIRAWIEEPDRGERLSKEADDLADRFPVPDDRPPLYGVPVGVKDIFHVEGLPTRAGSDLPPETLAGTEAIAVTALRDAGALVAGKTVTTEFAYFEPGPTRNPHDTDHTPGGSSSGSAAAVAAGMVPLALGTQTAGSVLRPAAFCGVVGFKPTFGRVPTAGVIQLAESLDTVGWFTQDVAGARLAASVLCEEWGGDEDADDRSGAPDDLPTLGVPDEAYLSRATEAGRDQFRSQVDTLETAGFEVVETGVLADVDEIEERHADLMAAEAALAHRDWYEHYGDRYAGTTADLIEAGQSVGVGRLFEVREERADVRAAIESTMTDAGIDCLVSPAAPGPAPEGLDDTGDPVMNAPWTYAGMPAISVPAGKVDGLPVGLQCVAAGEEDERLLAWAGPIADALDRDD